MILDLNPVIVQLGPLAIRWYGVMMGLSFALGSYYMLKNGRKQGFDEDFILGLAIAAIIGAVIGARLLYVLVNWPDFARQPLEILRIDRGGLAFHGGLLGGIFLSLVVLARRGVAFSRVADLAVPGIAIGIMLVRIANIFNQEIIGRTATLLPFGRHPTQIYGSLIGLTLLLIHNYLARRPHAPGTLFWSFVFYYTLLRGVIEETFRQNPLVLLGYVNESWGTGFFTHVHLATIPVAVFAWLMIRRAQRLFQPKPGE